MTLRQLDYDWYAQHYDAVELHGCSESEQLNCFLGELFRHHGVAEVIDITCGTGAQALGLAKRGFSVRAFDRSAEMLRAAQQKAGDLPIVFEQQDARNFSSPACTAVIAMYNAIGHLLPGEFAEVVACVRSVLGPGGLFVFDIFNLPAVKRCFLAHPYIDKAHHHNGITYVRFNRNQLDPEAGVMHVNQRLYVQAGDGPYEVRRMRFDLQTYSAEQLQTLLGQHDLRIAQLYGGPGQPFEYEASHTLLCVAEVHVK